MSKTGFRIGVWMLTVVLTTAGCGASWERCPCGIGEKQQVIRDRCGEPQDGDRTRTMSGSSETWIYWHYDWLMGYQPNLGKRYVFFRNGAVVGVHDE